MMDKKEEIKSIINELVAYGVDKEHGTLDEYLANLDMTAERILKLFAIPVVSFAKRKVCRCYEVPPKKNTNSCDTCGRAYI